MASLAHRSKQRRAERAPLTAYDLTLPPTVVTADQARASGEEPKLNLLLAVRIESNQIRVEHSGAAADGQQGFVQTINGVSGASLDTLETVMKDIRRQYPQNSDVLVVPADDVSYDDVIHVLERLKIATFTGISLGNRTRSTQIASAGEVVR